MKVTASEVVRAIREIFAQAESERLRVAEETGYGINTICRCPRCGSADKLVFTPFPSCQCGWQSEWVTAPGTSNDETLDTLLRDIGRAAVARQNAGKFPIDLELWSQGANRLRLLCAKLTPEQITACVEWVKKDATK